MGRGRRKSGGEKGLILEREKWSNEEGVTMIWRGKVPYRECCCDEMV